MPTNKNFSKIPAEVLAISPQITQSAWCVLTDIERKYLKQVGDKKKQLEVKQAEMSVIYDDIRNAEDLYLLYAKDTLAEAGIKEKATVIFTPLKTTHTINSIFLDRENGMMAVLLYPMPQVGFMKKTYAHQLQVVKVKENKLRNDSKRIR